MYMIFTVSTFTIPKHVSDAITAAINLNISVKYRGCMHISDVVRLYFNFKTYINSTLQNTVESYVT